MAVTEDLIIGVDRFRYFCSINDSNDAEFLAPYILQATDTIAQNILGTALTEKIISDYNAGTLAGVYQELYSSSKSRLERMVCWQAYRLGLPTMAIKINNNSVTRHVGDGESSSNSDLAMLIRNADATLVTYENQVKKYLSENQSSFPELADTTPEFLKSNLTTSDTSQGTTYTPNLYFNDY